MPSVEHQITSHLRPRNKTVKGKKKLVGFAAEFYHPHRHPKRKYVSLKTKDKATAMARFTEYRKACERGDWDPWVDTLKQNDVMLRATVEEYLTYLDELPEWDPQKKRKNTIQGIKSTLNQLVRALDTICKRGLLIRQVQMRHLSDFLYGKKLARNSVATMIGRLGPFFRWAIEKGYIETSPTEGLHFPPMIKTTVEYLTREQYRHLIQTLQTQEIINPRYALQWLIDVIVVAVGTGMRRGELINLRWGAVDLEKRLVHVRNEFGFRTKNGDERTIPLTGEALATFQRLYHEREIRPDTHVFRQRNGNPLTPSISHVFPRYRRLAGLSDRIRFHSLRHTFASWLAMAGVDAFRIKELMGHRRIEMTMRYMHLAPEGTRAAMEEVFGSEPTSALH